MHPSSALSSNPVPPVRLPPFRLYVSEPDPVFPLGSPVATTNQAGTVIDRTSYEPYGKAIGETLDGVGYTGHVMDPVSGLVYMQQRYYDPVIGRFLSADPVKTDPDSGDIFDRYSYAAGSPYVFIDPDGRRNGRVNPNPDLRSLTPSEKAAITRIIAKSHGIDLGELPIVTSPGDGAILGVEALFIYDETFRTRSNLAAAIGHEWEMHYETHIKERGGSYSPSAEQYHVDEAEAFQYNIDNAQRFGNTKAEVQGFRESRDGHAAAGQSLREAREERARERSKREREEDQK